MLKGSTMTLFFSPNNNRVEMNMGMIMQTKVISDYKAQKGIMLMDGMMGKKATEMDLSKKDESKEGDESGNDDGLTIEKTSDTKKIAGFKCVKYIITTEEGAVMNYWVTDELIVDKEGIEYMSKKVDGFPLEFEVSAEGMTMVFTATEVEKNLKAHNKKELFDMKIPEGYEVMSEEDLKGMGM